MRNAIMLGPKKRKNNNNDNKWHAEPAELSQQQENHTSVARMWLLLWQLQKCHENSLRSMIDVDFACGRPTTGDQPPTIASQTSASQLA